MPPEGESFSDAMAPVPSVATTRKKEIVLLRESVGAKARIVTATRYPERNLPPSYTNRCDRLELEAGPATGWESAQSRHKPRDFQ